MCIQVWTGDGRHDDLQENNLRQHLRKKGSELRAPSRDKKHPKDGPLRYKSGNAVVRVAALVLNFEEALDAALECDWERDELPNAQEQAAALRKRNAQLEEQVRQVQDMARRAVEAHRKAQARAKDHITDRAAAVVDACEKLKVTLVGKHTKETEKLQHRYVKELDELEATLDDVVMERDTRVKQMQVEIDSERARAEAVESEAAQKQESLENQTTELLKVHKKYLNTARQRARDAENAKEKAERKVARLEKDLEDAQAESESEPEDDAMGLSDVEEDVPPRRLPFELLPRRDESGRFQAEAWQVRALRWAQEARGVAPSTVSHNIQDVIDLLMPGLEVPATTKITNTVIRTEVTLAGEAMAAWKFAAAKRILSFGWDESTKFGNAVFSCNFQIVNADDTIEDICLRGLSIMPAGGTSRAVLEHIEKRILSYARNLLQGWMEAFEKKYAGDTCR